MEEEVSDFRGEGRIGRGVVMRGSEVGTGVGTAKKAGSFVVSTGSLFGSVEGAEPHSDLLSGVLDLSHPFP